MRPSQAEIAKSLGMTENAVKQAFHRLRRRYRELLREEISHTVAVPATSRTNYAISSLFCRRNLERNFEQYRRDGSSDRDDDDRSPEFARNAERQFLRTHPRDSAAFVCSGPALARSMRRMTKRLTRTNADGFWRLRIAGGNWPRRTGRCLSRATEKSQSNSRAKDHRPGPLGDAPAFEAISPGSRGGGETGTSADRSYYEIGERDGSCYFSMKFIEGGQLDEVVRREPMSTRHAAELLVKIARTVQFAHEHGILHRDIKPGNILLDKKGEPHLTDFGLARLIEQESTVTRTSKCWAHRATWRQNRHAATTQELTSATDVYGLGAVFYQMLTGQSPICWRNNLRNDSAGFGNRAAATATLKSESGSRSCHDLPEVSRERSAAPLRFRSGAGRRS